MVGHAKPIRVTKPFAPLRAEQAVSRGSLLEQRNKGLARKPTLICARTEPALPLTRSRARGQLTELRQEDLRFGRGEAAAFLDQTMALKLSDKPSPPATSIARSV